MVKSVNREDGIEKGRWGGWGEEWEEVTRNMF